MDYTLKSDEFKLGHSAAIEVKDVRRDIMEQVSLLKSAVQAFETIFDDSYNAQDYEDCRNLLSNISEHTLFAKKLTDSVARLLNGLMNDDPKAYQFYLKSANGYCEKHDCAFIKLWGDWMCESCYVEAVNVHSEKGWCSPCKSEKDLINGRYCREHYEIYRDEVVS